MESQVRSNIKVHAIPYMDFPSQSTPRKDTLQVTSIAVFQTHISAHESMLLSGFSTRELGLFPWLK